MNKVLTRIALRRRLDGLRRRGKRIVFTNGCFDLIHPGHVRYLRAAKRLGDVLVVGLNSDASEVMAALEMVDYVAVFGEDTPYNLIKQVQPDVLVKGGDWKPDQIVGADIVRARGGVVRSLRFAAGYSTTRLVERIGRKSRVDSRESRARR